MGDFPNQPIYAQKIPKRNLQPIVYIRNWVTKVTVTLIQNGKENETDPTPQLD